MEAGKLPVINLLQALVVLPFAPLAKGVLNRLKERMLERDNG